jgi:type IV pilus assembly protein PilE
MELHRHKRIGGFTLTELMIVVVIASILLAVAIPSYTSQIRKSRRTEARTAILDLAGREERFFSTNGSAYTGIPGNLGYAAFGVGTPIGNGYYFLTVCVPANANCVAGLGMPNPPAAPSYTIVASPVPGQTQANDTQCGQFAVDSVGQQYAVTTAGGNNTPFCWTN